MTPPLTKTTPWQEDGSVSSGDEEDKKQRAAAAPAADDEPSSAMLLSQLVEEMESLEDGGDEATGGTSKSAYAQAIEKVPELVAKESDPILFLRSENYDPRRAAARLAGYWKQRLVLFGEERAFLPMVCTGYGALSHQDVELLKTGPFVILPKDKHGRSVLLFTEEHRTSSTVEKMYGAETRFSRFRGLFYLFQKISEDEDSRSKGVLLVRSSSRPKLAPGRQQRFYDLVQAHPIYFYRCYNLCRPSSMGEKRLWKEQMVPAMKQAMPAAMSKRTHFVVALSTEEMVAAMKEEEVLQFLNHERGLPACLGGNWSYDMFANWLKLWSQYEHSLYGLKYYNQHHGDESNKNNSDPTTNTKPPPPPGTAPVLPGDNDATMVVVVATSTKSPQQQRHSGEQQQQQQQQHPPPSKRAPQHMMMISGSGRGRDGEDHRRRTTTAAAAKMPRMPEEAAATAALASPESMTVVVVSSNDKKIALSQQQDTATTTTTLHDSDNHNSGCDDDDDSSDDSNDDDGGDNDDEEEEYYSSSDSSLERTLQGAEAMIAQYKRQKTHCPHDWQQQMQLH